MDWSHKNLDFIVGSNIESRVLIDDFEAYVESSQKKQWIKVAQFAEPYPSDDAELVSMLCRLQDIETPSLNHHE